MKKTIKINELTHQHLTELQSLIYKNTNKKKTFDEIISEAIIHETTKLAVKYNYLRGITLAAIIEDKKDEQK